MIYGINNSLQLINTVKCIGYGNIIGFVYLLLNENRSKTRKHLLHDIFFIIICLFFGYFFIIDINYGVFRIYLLIAEIAGFLLLSHKVIFFYKRNEKLIK